MARYEVARPRRSTAPPSTDTWGSLLITVNFLTRVLLLRTTKGGLGTGFTIEINDRQYLITARHVLPDPDGPNRISLEGPAHVDAIQFDPLPGIHPGADIAVCPVEGRLTRDLAVDPSMHGMAYGQDAYFLGYPYGIGLGDEQPEAAFVKKCILSASTHTPDGLHLLYLDGHNNPGFSGGPVIFYKGADRYQPQIAAIVSGYRIDRAPVEVDGEVDPSVLVQANSGIVIATDIRHAVEAIDPGHVQGTDT